MTMICVGKRIKEVRLERFFSQEVLAKLIGTNRQTILNWESGETSIKATSLMKICVACDCNPEYILGFSNEITNLNATIKFEISEKEIGKRIRKVRRARGLSQCAVSEKIGKKGSSCISAWEIGKRSLSVECLSELCKIYECDVNYILGFSDKMNLSKINVEDSGIKEEITTLVRTFLFIDEKGKKLLMAVASSEAARCLAQGSNKLDDTSNINVYLEEI